MLNSGLVQTGFAVHHQQPTDELPEESRTSVTKGKAQDENVCGPHTITEQSVDATTDNCVSCATPASQGSLPNGLNATRCSPQPTRVYCTADEGRPLISPPPESVELTVWSSEGRVGPPQEASHRGQCCCQCKCCRSGRVPAFLSVLASFLFAVGIFYALYFYVPVKPPDCPDAASRITFTLCCCVVASVPVLLGRLPPAHVHQHPRITDKDYGEDLLCLAASLWNVSSSPAPFNLMCFHPRHLLRPLERSRNSLP